MTRRRPRALRASTIRSWTSAAPAAVTSSGSAIWAMTLLYPILYRKPHSWTPAYGRRFAAKRRLPGWYHRLLPMRHWQIPEGLRVLADGSWRVGELQVLHPPTLRYLKKHLVDEGGAPFVVDGAQRMPIQVEGPA